MPLSRSASIFARDRVRAVDVVDLHLDPGDAVAVLVEGLGFVEVGVDELRVVLVEAGLEDGDDPEALGDRRARAGPERHADLGRSDLHAVAEADIELSGQRPADHDARHLGDLLGALAGVGVDGVREAVVVGQLALVAAGGGHVARRAEGPRGLDPPGCGGPPTFSGSRREGRRIGGRVGPHHLRVHLAAHELQERVGPGVPVDRGRAIEHLAQRVAKRIARALRRLGAGSTQPGEAALDDVLRKIEHLGHQLGVDALEEHPGRRAIAVGHHHRVDDERRHADDAGHALDLLHHVAVLAEIDRVLEDQHVRVDAEHLLAKLLLKAARDAHHDRQRGHAEQDPADGERRADRDHAAFLGREIAERDGEGVAHRRVRGARSGRRAKGSYHGSRGARERPVAMSIPPGAPRSRARPRRDVRMLAHRPSRPLDAGAVREGRACAERLHGLPRSPCTARPWTIFPVRRAA